MKVELLDYMGSDDSIVNAARVSFKKRASQFTTEQNKNLIEYLAANKHEIPFAHTAITLRVKAPISIRTQCFKHKIGFVESEVSRRYVTDDPEIFIPTFREKPEKEIKQGSGDTHADHELLAGSYKEAAYICINLYKGLLANGVAPEQARFILPQGTMTEWVWTGSLLAFMRFYKLRTGVHAQKEIKTLALMVEDVIKPIYPISWEALALWN